MKQKRNPNIVETGVLVKAAHLLNLELKAEFRVILLCSFGSNWVKIIADYLSLETRFFLAKFDNGHFPQASAVKNRMSWLIKSNTAKKPP